MRVLFVIERYWPDFGGAETVSEEFIDAQRVAGDEFEVITSHGNAPGLADVELHRGVPVRRLRVVEAVRANDVGALLDLRRTLRAHLERFQPDLVHITVLGPLSWLMAQVLDTLPLPVVVSVQGLDSVTGAGSSAQRRVLARADQVIACSRGVLAWAKSIEPGIMPRSRVVYNALPAPALAPSPAANGATFLCAGRMVAQKGFHLAIEAFARLSRRHPRARLRLAGDGRELETLRRVALVSGVAERVEFAGRLSRPEVLAAMRDALACVLPSRGMEGFPLAIVEAAQMARCTIATNLPGVAEMVDDDVNGLLVPPGDVARLSAAMERLLLEPALAARLGAAAQKRASEELSFAKLLDAYRSTYQAAVGECAA